ncbi:hypothetical protein L596_003538 [Steinernema carpocapsae]|uniref:Uncharacterized protein n=1 Tax=Steinernema carpocapsae TaxID=34508 RepID=A0A4U8USU2_STECR|nr:hypothetical protein L596_003538 [Steinernema carpocapsae]
MASTEDSFCKKKNEDLSAKRNNIHANRATFLATTHSRKFGKLKFALKKSEEDFEIEYKSDDGLLTISSVRFRPSAIAGPKKKRSCVGRGRKLRRSLWLRRRRRNMKG